MTLVETRTTVLIDKDKYPHLKSTQISEIV